MLLLPKESLLNPRQAMKSPELKSLRRFVYNLVDSLLHIDEFVGNLAVNVVVDSLLDTKTVNIFAKLFVLQQSAIEACVRLKITSRERCDVINSIFLIATKTSKHITNLST